MKMFARATSTLLAFFALTPCCSVVVRAQELGADYIDSVPPTVYEADEPSPQNMDFDKENNMFIAHAGWYNDFEIHYYKFRMYTPSTYGGVIVSATA